jgi:hypothetical protein
VVRDHNEICRSGVLSVSTVDVVDGGFKVCGRVAGSRLDRSAKIWEAIKLGANQNEKLFQVFVISSEWEERANGELTQLRNPSQKPRKHSYRQGFCQDFFLAATTLLY